MSLRAKLVISFTLLLLVVIAGVGMAASRSVRNILVAQIDQELVGLADRGPVPQARPNDGFEPIGPGAPEDVLRQFAEAVISPDGTMILSRPSGFTDDPDPLPDFAGVSEAAAGLIDLDSVDGSLDYRAFVRVQPEGALVVHAVPLKDVARATSDLIRNLVLAGAGVLLLGGAATWWTVRGAMRPVDDMVETAEHIAGGDLTRRVPATNPGTELGRLGNSLNDMLAHIEHAVESEREGQELLRQFVADASHELRTPVAAISGYAELHRKGGLEAPEDSARAWSRIESESRRMGNLVKDLLTLTRLGQGERLHLADTDVAEIVRNAAADHRAIDPDRPVTVTGSAGATVNGDHERLHQVVSNLLSNARVHTPPGTPIEINVAEQNGSILISVTDDGPGIPESSLDHVFDRFYRADRSRSRKSGGSGLGLAIVAAVVSAHGGTVAATNPPGRGARFTIELPARSLLS